VLDFMLVSNKIAEGNKFLNLRFPPLIILNE
jgi:hypothetical protein